MALNISEDEGSDDWSSIKLCSSVVGLKLLSLEPLRFGLRLRLLGLFDELRARQRRPPGDLLDERPRALVFRQNLAQ